MNAICPLSTSCRGFYHLMQHLPGRGVFAFLPCWSTSPLSVSSLSTPQEEIVECQSAPFQFYLESVWFCGGVTIILIYLYALHLNGSVQSALYAAVCYLMSHSYAGIIYEKPMARENFALPLILMQMFYLSMYMENSKQSGYQRENILMVLIPVDFYLLSSHVYCCFFYLSLDREFVGVQCDRLTVLAFLGYDLCDSDSTHDTTLASGKLSHHRCGYLSK